MLQSNEYIAVKYNKMHNMVNYYGPPGGGPLFETHLNTVTAFLRDSFF